MHAIAGVWGTQDKSSLELCRALLDAVPGEALGSSQAQALQFVAVGSRSIEQLRTPGALGAVGLPCAPHSAGLLVVSDTRLDNRDRLAIELGLTPDNLQNTTDSELIALAWRCWREDAVRHLEGAFAFACWDSTARVLFLARDHGGEKPLYFARTRDLFAFSSHPEGLRSVPEVSGSLDENRLLSFVTLLSPQTGQTFFKGVEKLSPAHFLIRSSAKTVTQRYWRPWDGPSLRYKRNSEYLDDLTERFERAVGLRSLGEGSVGSQLSAGLDSAAVTVVAARLLANKAPFLQLLAFTAVPVPGSGDRTLPGRFADEGPAAAGVAAIYRNITHVRLSLAGKPLWSSLARASLLTGEPVFNPLNQMWTYAILDAARDRELRVLLQATGGNASISFDGLAALGDLFRQWQWVRLLRTVRRLRGKGRISWRGAASWALAPALPLVLRRLFSPEMRRFDLSYSPVNPDRANEGHLRAKAFEEFYGKDSDSEAQHHALLDSYDPGSANWASAAGWGVECRDPTLDKSVLEFCASVPMEQFLAGDETRSLARRLLRGKVPVATIESRMRGLQGADWHLIFGGILPELARELSWIESSPIARHVLDLPRLRRLLESWPEGGFDQPCVYDEYHVALTRGLAAGRFIAKHDPSAKKQAPEN